MFKPCNEADLKELVYGFRDYGFTAQFGIKQIIMQSPLHLFFPYFTRFFGQS